MLSPDYHNDSEKVLLTYLLAEIRKVRNDVGGYIEHFYHDEETIIIKLTNGILKIQEAFLEKHFSANGDLTEKEIKQLADSFTNSTII